MRTTTGESRREGNTEVSRSHSKASARGSRAGTYFGLLLGFGDVTKSGNVVESQKGLGDCARQVLQELDTVRSREVVLLIKNTTEVQLRLVVKPDKLAADLLARMQLKIPTPPKQVQNVVEKNGP